MRNKKTLNIVLSGMFIAIGLVLPLLTGQIPQIGKMLSPMHIPVLLCGFVCGWPYGLAVGLITPLLRSAIFHMPLMFPTAVAMAFELATYGAVAGAMYALFSKKNLVAVYVTLVVAMLCGRVVWGVASMILYGIQSQPFTMQMFLAGAFINAVPGIVLHLILIPAIVLTLERSGVMRMQRAEA